MSEIVATVITALVVAGIVAFIVFSLIRDRRKNPGCPSSCCGCPHAKTCQAGGKDVRFL